MRRSLCDSRGGHLRAPHLLEGQDEAGRTPGRPHGRTGEQWHHTHAIARAGHQIRKRRAKLRSWWYGTPDNEKAMTFMGGGVGLVAVAVGAWFVIV